MYELMTQAPQTTLICLTVLAAVGMALVAPFVQFVVKQWFKLKVVRIKAETMRELKGSGGIAMVSGSAGGLPGPLAEIMRQMTGGGHKGDGCECVGCKAERGDDEALVFLVRVASNDKHGGHESAQQKLTNIAIELGVTAKKLEDVDDWSDVAILIKEQVAAKEAKAKGADTPQCGHPD